MSKIKFNSEKCLEDFICEYIVKNNICPISKENVTYYYRQVNLGAYGIADIVKISIEEDGGGMIVTVLELKNEKITKSCISQVLRYKTGLLELLKFQFPDNYENISFYAEILGAGIERGNDTCYLLNEIETLCAYSFDISVNGGFEIEELGSSWILDNHYFDNDIVFDFSEAIMDSKIKYDDFTIALKNYESSIALVKK